MDKYLAACWYVLGMTRAKRRLNAEWARFNRLARQGITGGFFNPFHGWELLDFAKLHGFRTEHIGKDERACEPEPLIAASAPASRRGT